MDHNLINMTSKDLKIMYKTLDKLIRLNEEQYVFLMEGYDNNALLNIQNKIHFYRNVWLTLINELIVRDEI